jgi:heme-binding NEAT domain protein
MQVEKYQTMLENKININIKQNQTKNNIQYLMYIIFVKVFLGFKYTDNYVLNIKINPLSVINILSLFETSYLKLIPKLHHPNPKVSKETNALIIFNKALR